MDTLDQRNQRLSRISELELTRIGTDSAFISGATSSYKEIWNHRQLLNLLIKREIRSKYKGSSLGILWSFVRPLTQLLIYYFIIGEVLGVARAIPDFAIYVFVGLTAWGLFAEILGSSSVAILSNSGIIKKVYLPREIFPLSSIASALFTFGTQFLILIAATFIFGSPPNWAALPTAILGFLVLLVFSSALALIISSVNVYVRDVQHFVEVLVGLLFWATPIVYSFTFVKNQLSELWISIYLANPVTLAIVSFQDAFWSAGQAENQKWPSHLDTRLFIALLVSLILLFISQRLFSRLQKSFAQEL